VAWAPEIVDGRGTGVGWRVVASRRGHRQSAQVNPRESAAKQVNNEMKNENFTNEIAYL